MIVVIVGVVVVVIVGVVVVAAVRAAVDAKCEPLSALLSLSSELEQNIMRKQ